MICTLDILADHYDLEYARCNDCGSRFQVTSFNRDEDDEHWCPDCHSHDIKYERVLD